MSAARAFPLPVPRRPLDGTRRLCRLVYMETRQRMIEAAIVLMRRAGVRGAGVNDVLGESRAPRGSLYHHFPGGKRQIACEALREYGERVAANMASALASGATPGEKVRALFRAVAGRLEAGEFRHSCAAGAAALDLDASLEDVRARVEHDFARWVAVIAEHLPLGNERASRAFASLLLTAIEGGYVRGRAEHSSAALVEAGEWLAALADAQDGVHTPADPHVQAKGQADADGDGASRGPSPRPRRRSIRKGART
jgi:TetR/AcrR family transcriptional repressor of lmrAB and yxaGH operons